MAYNSKEKETPNWKKDFPVKKDEATHVSRREFAKFLCLLSGGMALGNGIIAIKSFAFPSKELEGEHFICNTSDVAIGQTKEFIIEGEKNIPYLLIHLSEGKWRAFEQKCTHLSCAVRYNAEINKIECPCHKGFFDADTGTVLAGPPPRPLPQLSVHIKNEKVYVSAYKESKTIS
ncbi:ubiquinol-cytochrome c reductase iron-sulfur subunit [Xanthovirga aplysinae]|uniref:QcrA and Rieske domain-containing protein n=1 Tax=Xanthovirga aplysinae TaxID=2529853 RepID=UPI0012BC9CF8|nr:Rieske (2Fe-2S) protein [Xanthovirga aplysinae]MTI31727.1 Rieske (2Fe-2S) protein [Xanthovirga aplysinae]